MEFDNWIHKQDKVIQIVLLVIPVVNWVMEVLIRWSKFLRDTSNTTNLLVAILVIPFGLVVGWIDAVMVILDKPLLLE